MTATPPLFILRHGETMWNKDGRMQGSLDSPLTPLGRVQAARQGAILRAHGLDAPSFVSPKPRAHTTAALAGLQPTIDPDLAEISMGRWQGLIRPAGSDATGVLWKFSAPDCESQTSLISRLKGFLSRCTGPTIIVTHGVVSIGLRALLTGADPNQWDHFDDPQGVVHRVVDGEETLFS